jgi:Fur family transcriptional regulator, ferric uptake regulator
MLDQVEVVIFASPRDDGEGTRRTRGVGEAKSTPVEILKEPWRAYLRKKRLKTTQQREAIVDAFLRSSGHVALDELLISARKRNPGVGLATVYRTVKLLEEAGLAHSRQFGSGQTLYEVAGQRAHHDHLICQQCHHIVEFESDEIEVLQERVAKRLGFNILHHRHEIFGLCEKAQGVPGGFCPADRLRRK